MDIIVNGEARIDPKGHFDPRLVEVLRRHDARMDEIHQTFSIARPRRPSPKRRARLKEIDGRDA